MRWNSLERAGGVGAEDAVFLAGVEAERVEAALELDDVVAAQHRAADVEHAITEAEAALDQRGPGLAAADAVDSQRSVFLERPKFTLRGRTEAPELLGRDRMSERDEPLLEVPDRFAAAARPEDGRIAQPMNSSRSWRSAPLPFAPTMRFAGLPSLKTSNVGMLITS